MRTLKEFIFQEMEKKGFVLDDELARFIKKTKGELVKRRGGDYYDERSIPFCQAEIYKREYRSLTNAKNEFENKENIEIKSYKNSYKGAKTKYYLRYKGMAENQFYKIPKIYYDYLKGG